MTLHQLQHFAAYQRQRGMQGGIHLIKRWCVTGYLFGIANKVEMRVDMLAEVVGNVFYKQGGKVSSLVLYACYAKGPFQVLQLVEARSFGQEAPVGDAWC